MGLHEFSRRFSCRTAQTTNKRMVLLPAALSDNVVAARQSWWGRRADGCLVASATSCCCGRPAPCGARYTYTHLFDKNRKKPKKRSGMPLSAAFSARLTPPRRRTSATDLHLATLCSLVQAVKGVGDTAVECDCRHLNGAARRACRKMTRVILKIALAIWEFVL